LVLTLKLPGGGQEKKKKREREREIIIMTQHVKFLKILAVVV
jgi:hypothetical protein